MKPAERNVDEFNRDVAEHDGYVYSTSDRLSCRLSNGRMTEAVMKHAAPSGKRIIDIGCGDGTYSLELLEAGASFVLGVDAAAGAVESAKRRAGAHVERGAIDFEVVDIYALPEPDELFDVAVVRGMLHHLYDAPAAIERISRVAREVVVVEPNGYNPILKVIEKTSPYHIEHEEKSYAPRRLDGWFEACGGVVDGREYIGLVPIFSPDWLARVCKALEPWVERIPLLRQLGCAQYVQRVRTSS